MSTTNTETHIILFVKTRKILDGNIQEGVKFTDNAGDPPGDWSDNPANFQTTLDYPGTLKIYGRNYNINSSDPDLAGRRVLIKSLVRRDPNGLILLENISLQSNGTYRPPDDNPISPNYLQGTVVDPTGLGNDPVEDYDLIINIYDKNGNVLRDINDKTDFRIDPKLRMRSRGGSH